MLELFISVCCEDSGSCFISHLHPLLLWAFGKFTLVISIVKTFLHVLQNTGAFEISISSFVVRFEVQNDWTLCMKKRASKVPFPVRTWTSQLHAPIIMAECTGVYSVASIGNIPAADNAHRNFSSRTIIKYLSTFNGISTHISCNVSYMYRCVFLPERVQPVQNFYSRM